MVLVENEIERFWSGVIAGSVYLKSALADFGEWNEPYSVMLYDPLEQGATRAFHPPFN